MKCDIYTPDGEKEKWAPLIGFSPIFKKAEFRPSADNVGDYQFGLLQERNLRKGTQRKLVTSYFAENALIYTPLLQFYLNQGLRITAVHDILEFDRGRPFAEYSRKIADARRCGDIRVNGEKPYKVISDLQKLKASCPYGKACENLGKYNSTVYVNEEQARQLCEDIWFKSVEHLGDCYGVDRVKQTVHWKRPVQLAVAVYHLAKLCILPVPALPSRPPRPDQVAANVHRHRLLLYRPVHRHAARGCAPREARVLRSAEHAVVPDTRRRATQRSDDPRRQAAHAHQASARTAHPAAVQGGVERT